MAGSTCPGDILSWVLPLVFFGLAPAGGGHDEKEPALNQPLAEFDGLGQSHGIVLLAATNRPEVLDPAPQSRGGEQSAEALTR